MFLQGQVGVRGTDVVVLGVEKKSVAKLQEERTVRKICLLDDHVVMAFAGAVYKIDAKILILCKIAGQNRYSFYNRFNC